MNCSETRGHFSELLDQRLPVRERDLVRQHVERCGDCREHWERYRKVFEIVGAAPTLPAPAFVHPNALAPRPVMPAPRRSWFRTQAFRAAAALLLITSHAAIFLVGRESRPEGSPSITLEGASPPPVVRVASLLDSDEQVQRRQALRDHTEAAELFMRQVANLQHAGAPAVELASLNLDLLRPERLISGEDQIELEKEFPGTGDYLQGIAALEARASECLGNPRTRTALKSLMIEIERLELLGMIAPLQARLRREAVGRAWARNLAEAAPNPSPAVAPFFAAQNQLLLGDFVPAANAFHQFANLNPRHPLAQLARSMECESWVRVGRFDQAFGVLGTGSFAVSWGRGRTTDFLGNFVQESIRRPEVQMNPAALLPPLSNGPRLRIIIQTQTSPASESH